MENLSPNILNKLEKLIALYKGAKDINSESEANNAAAAIHNILIKYNLEMADVEAASAGRVKAEEIGEFKESCYRYKCVGGDWELILMSTICKWNFCNCFRLGHSKEKRMLIIGKKSNLETVKWLYDFLSEKYYKSAHRRYKEWKEIGWYDSKPIGKDTWFRRYLTGCANGLNEKFKSESDDQKVQDTVFSDKVTALVKVNNAEIQSYIDSRYATGKGRNMRGVSSSDEAYRRGKTDGRNTDLYRQLDENNGSYKETKMLL